MRVAVSAPSLAAEPEYGSAEYAPDRAAPVSSAEPSTETAAVVPPNAAPATDGSAGDIAVAVSDAIMDIPSKQDADRLLRERQRASGSSVAEGEKFREMLAREAS